MRLADYFIGKPGPGSLSEALAMRLPVIVERNAWTLPQERYNADWVRESEVGLVVDSFRHIAGALSNLLEPERLARLQANAARLTNRGVFEIPDILEGILNRQNG
jgi:UDP-N-acetylglucosamine:LPS N-acetylglucosamine transferase